MDNVAFVAITKHGVELIRKLSPSMPKADLYYMSKFARGDEQEKGITLFDGSVRLQFPAMFEKYDGVRGFWNPDRQTFFSRTGKPFLFPSSITQQMPSLFLDGELWFYEDPHCHLLDRCFSGRGHLGLL